MPLIGRKPIGTVSYMGGVPAVLEEFCWSWSQLVQFNCEQIESPQSFIHYDRAKYSDHAPARNSLVRNMQGDWLLQLDTDHQFEPDLLARILRLYRETGARVISGLYRFKKPPYAPVAFGGETGTPVLEWASGLELFEITGAGAGCLFAERSVFDEIRAKCKCEPFDRMPSTSEDHSFFRRCKECGIKTYLAPNIEFDHLIVSAVTSKLYDGELLTSQRSEVGGFSNG